MGQILPSDIVCKRFGFVDKQLALFELLKRHLLSHSVQRLPDLSSSSDMRSSSGHRLRDVFILLNKDCLNGRSSQTSNLQLERAALVSQMP